MLWVEETRDQSDDDIDFGDFLLTVAKLENRYLVFSA